MIKKRISKLRDKFLDFGIDGYILALRAMKKYLDK